MRRMKMNVYKTLSRIIIVQLIFVSFYFAQTDYEKSRATEVWEPIPEVVTPGEKSSAPSDAIILLNDNNLLEWEHDDGSSPKWIFCEGVLTVKKETGQIKTKRKFGDCQLHIEWRTPKEIDGEGQGRGNSGIFLMEKYEVQVLDSYNNSTYSNGQAGSIYKQYIPLVNACKPPGEWQDYDIIFKAPKFNEDGTVLSPAYITVIQNGVLIQNNVEIKGSTEWIGAPNYKTHNSKESITIQDHGNPVSYRNIWIREL